MPKTIIHTVKTIMKTLGRLFILGAMALGLSAGAHTTQSDLPVPKGQFMPGLDSLKVEKLGEGLYTFRYLAYRSIFMITDEGVIVTDPQSPKAAEKYLAEIRKLTDKPIKYVVYSHSHWDHISGGQVFKDEGATFISQEKCLDNLKASPNPDVVPADITFKDTYSVELGGTSLDLYHFGPSHDTCLAVMVPGDHKMMQVTDLVSGPTGAYVPFDPVAADFHFYNAVNYLEQMEALAEERGLEQIISAHLVPKMVRPGMFEEQPALGPIKAITEKRIFWDDLIKAVKKALDEGANPLFVQHQMDLTPFEHYRGFKEEEFKILVARVSTYHAIGR